MSRPSECLGICMTLCALILTAGSARANQTIVNLFHLNRSWGGHFTGLRQALEGRRALRRGGALPGSCDQLGASQRCLCQTIPCG